MHMDTSEQSTLNIAHFLLASLKKGQGMCDL